MFSKSKVPMWKQQARNEKEIPMQSTAEKRRFWRAAFSAPAHLIDSRGDNTVSVIDLSLHGALVETPPAWPGGIGDQCQLKIDLSEAVSIELCGTVTHLAGRQIGLRCDRIDLDSITHLRRLVELNAGDPALLDREMPHLLTAS